MKPPDKIRPKVAFELTYVGRRTVRGRIGFALMRLGARLARQPIELRRTA